MVGADGGNDLKFNIGWSMVNIDQWLRCLLPKPFEWLDACRGILDIHWVLLNSDRQNHFVLTWPTITGRELDKVKGVAGRRFTSYSIAIDTLFLILLVSISNNIIIPKLPESPFRILYIPTGMQQYRRLSVAAHLATPRPPKT